MSATLPAALIRITGQSVMLTEFKGGRSFGAPRESTLAALGSPSVRVGWFRRGG
jgi:hypothetical protein